MNIGEFRLLAKLFLKADVPLRIWGPGGIGKSKGLQSLAQELNYHFVDLRLAEMEVGDLIGIPYTKDIISSTGTVTTVTCWAMPNWLYEMWEKHNAGIPSILALEEKTRAPKEVTQAAFQLLTEKKIHEHNLPPTCRIFALDNPPTEEYDVAAADRAENTRWGNIFTQASPDDWVQGYGIHHSSSELVSFILVNKDSLIAPDKSQWDVESVIFRTPRTWELADRIWKSIKDEFSPQNPAMLSLLRLGIGACVGIAQSTAFIDSLCREWISLKDILTGKVSYEKVSIDSTQILRLYYNMLLYLSNDDLLTNGKMDREKVRTLSEFILGMSGDGRKDLAIGLLRNLQSKKQTVTGVQRHLVLTWLLQYGDTGIPKLVGEVSQEGIDEY